ncbi:MULTISPECIES: isocitrate/isopropylmalate family dehydrogenase [unclassified Streptomyces]|uniref:isocitrate/isopropylmalate family dehydrogenase n=1 Tax=unclassified Streptomyces TaxID=2593676 RepID=UPI00378F49C0
MKPVIGLAVGRGTGTEVAAVFERVLGTLARLHGTEIGVRRSPRTYHSYASLKAEGGVEAVRGLTAVDAGHYEDFCRTQSALGTPAIFRTAINAQSLYLVRQRLQAVKVDALPIGDGGALLLVRDQAQGFYTGENEHLDGVVRRTMEFSRDLTEKVLSYAVERAWRQWPGAGPARIVMAYKFHLLDGALDAWVTDLAARYDVPVGLFQPDTVNRNLITHGFPERTVVVAGNEWADIMHVVLLDRFGSDRQENRCTENVHLHPDVRGLVEYQTVHGSADDLEGLDRVNPVATVRAAAAIAERHGGCAGAVGAVEEALLTVDGQRVRTPDLGGRHSTTEVVDALLGALEKGGATAFEPAPPPAAAVRAEAS